MAGAPRQVPSKAPTTADAKVYSKNHNPKELQGAISAQDFGKRTTATRPISTGRSMKGRR